MRSPYIPHLVGEEALARVAGRRGWLTVGVSTSIAWPEQDVWLQYDGVEYFLLGAKRESTHTPAPCIATPCARTEDDETLARMYRFTSVLGYYMGGYVDITSRTSGSHIVPVVDSRDGGGLTTQAGRFNFNCNHMPIIEDDRVRKAMAFLREGRRLRRVHQPYSFLSFFKVLESQLSSKDREAWFNANLDLVEDEDAVKRIKELRDQGLDVGRHLFDSGRCAVAHASIGKDIVDPDIPSDRRRIAQDLDIIAALANRYIEHDAGVPDRMTLYRTRDRTAPWHALMTPRAVETLKAGGVVENADDLGKLAETKVSVRLWPEPPTAQFEAMTFLAEASGGGGVFFVALNERKTVILKFLMDVKNGRVHTLLDESGTLEDERLDERDVEDFSRYFHSVIANRTVELTIEGTEPVDCDVVIPVNIIPQVPEKAVAEALDRFRRGRAQRAQEGASVQGPTAGASSAEGAA